LKKRPGQDAIRGKEKEICQPRARHTDRMHMATFGLRRSRKSVGRGRDIGKKRGIVAEHGTVELSTGKKKEDQKKRCPLKKRPLKEERKKQPRGETRTS